MAPTTDDEWSPVTLIEQDRRRFLARLALGERPTFVSRLGPTPGLDPEVSWTGTLTWRLDGEPPLTGTVLSERLEAGDLAGWTRYVEDQGWRLVGDGVASGGYVEQAAEPTEAYGQGTMLRAAHEEADLLARYVRARRTRDLLFATAVVEELGSYSHNVATGVTADTFAVMATALTGRAPGPSECMARARALVEELQQVVPRT